MGFCQKRRDIQSEDSNVLITSTTNAGPLHYYILMLNAICNHGMGISHSIRFQQYDAES